MAVDTIITHYGLIAILIGAGIEGETVVVTGGLLAHRDLVPLWAAMAAAAAGSFLADQLFFLAGRHFRDRPRVRKLIDKPAFAKALDTLEKYPTGFILGFRFLYGLRTVSPIAVGTSKVSTHRFMVLNAIAAVAWGVVFTGLGYVFGGDLEALIGRVASPKRLLIAAVIIAVLIFVGVRVVRLVNRKRPRKRPRIDVSGG